MSLLTAAEVAPLLASDLSAANLQALIDREEAELVRLFGGNYVDGDTALQQSFLGGAASVWLPRPTASIEAVTEDGQELTAGTDFRFDKGLSRLVRLPAGAVWLSGAEVIVDFIPVDDTPQRKAALIELVRIAISRTAYQSESIGGDYSVTAPANWEAERSKVYRRLGFLSL